MAINEAMMLDSGKPVGGVTDDSKPLHNRQTELAMLVQDMVKKNAHTKQTKACCIIFRYFLYRLLIFILSLLNCSILSAESTKSKEIWRFKSNHYRCVRYQYLHIFATWRYGTIKFSCLSFICFLL